MCVRKQGDQGEDSDEDIAAMLTRHILLITSYYSSYSYYYYLPLDPWSLMRILLLC